MKNHRGYWKMRHTNRLWGNKTRWVMVMLIVFITLILSLSSVSAEWTDSLNTGLVAYWNMNDTSGDAMNIINQTTMNWTDVGGVGSAGGIIGTARGVTDASHSFSNNLSKILTNGSTDFTISYWINETAFRGYPTYFIAGVACQLLDTNGFCFTGWNFASNHYTLRWKNSAGTLIINKQGTYGPTRVVNQWYHYVITKNDLNITLYLNGSVIISEILTAPGDNINQNLVKIGNEVGHPGSGEYATEVIDELGIWNRSLNSTEVTQLFNDGVGITYAPSSGPPDTVSPDITIVYPLNTSYSINISAINYTVNDTNLDSCWYSLNLGITNTTMTCGTNLTGLTSTEGSNTWKVYANDTSNNLNTSSVTFYKDSTNPLLNIVYPVNNKHYSTSVIELNYTVSGTNIDSCWYTLNNGITNTTITCGNNVTGLLADSGAYTWRVYSNNTLGTIGSASSTFVIDTIAPFITWFNPTTGLNPFVKITFPLNVSVFDAYLDAVNVSLKNVTGSYIYTNFTGGITSNATFWVLDVLTLNEGANNIEICARDSLTDSPVIKDKAESKFIKIDNENTEFELPSGEKITRTFEIYDSSDKKLKVEDYGLFTNDSWVDDGKHYKTIWDLDNLPADSYFVIDMKYQRTDTLKLLSDRGVIRIIDSGYNYVWKYNDLSDAGFDVNYTFNAQNKKVHIVVKKGSYVPIGTHWKLDPIVAGLNTYCSNETINYDTTAPTISLQSPANNTFTNNATQNFTVSLTDAGVGIANATLYIYNSASTLYNITIFTLANLSSATVGKQLNGMPDGNYNWSYYSCDGLVNCGMSSNRTITIDTTYPTISYGVGTLNDGVNVSQNSVYINTTWTEVNFQNITFNLYNSSWINSTTYTTATYLINFTSIANGHYSYNATITDKSNQRNTTTARTILLDTVAPTVVQNYTIPDGGGGSITVPALNNTYINRSNITFVANISDILGGIKNITITITNESDDVVNQTTYPIQGGIFSYLLNLPLTLIDGIYKWVINSYDVASNFITTNILTLFIDTTPSAFAGQNNTFTWDNNPTRIHFINATITEINLNVTKINFNGTDYDVYNISDNVFEYNFTKDAPYVPYNINYYWWTIDNASNYNRSSDYYYKIICPSGAKTFNNSFCVEYLTFTGNQNITRWLSVPQNTILTKGMINLTYNMPFGLQVSNWTDSYTQGSTDGGYEGGMAITVIGGNRTLGNIIVGENSTYSYVYIRSGSFTGTNLTSGTRVGNNVNASYNLTNGTTYYLVTSGGGYHRYGGIGTPEYNKTSNGIKWISGKNPTNDLIDNGANGYDILKLNFSDAEYNASINIGTQEITSFLLNNETLNPTTININNLANAINSYLGSCVYAGGYCQVPFIFHSDNAGVLQYSNILFTNNGFIENNQTFNANTSVGALEQFTINITYDNNYYPSSSAIFNYNGTNYTATKVGSGNTILFTKNLTIPSISGTNQTNQFYWDIILINSSGSNYYQSTYNNQSVQSVSVDDCSVNTVKIYNFTMYDEDSLIQLNAIASNTTIEVSLLLYSMDNTLVTNYSQNFTKINPALICIKSGVLNTSTYKTDLIVRYDADPYVSEFYNEQKTTISNTTIPRIIPLYDLLTSRSQEFKITFKDSSLMPLSDYLVQINRKYISDGTFKTVEIGRTSGEGITLAHLVLAEAIYKLTLTKDGTIIYTYPEFQASCDNIITGDCQVTKYIYESAPSATDFYTIEGVQYTPIKFNSTTRVLSTSFTVVDGTSQILTLNATDLSGISLGSISLTSSSGDLSLTIPSMTIGNGMRNLTWEYYLTKNYGRISPIIRVTENENPIDLYGSGRIIMILGILITLVMMAVSSGAVMIIMFILGLFLSGGLGLMTLKDQAVGVGGIFGVLLAGILLVVLFLIKLNRTETSV